MKDSLLVLNQDSIDSCSVAIRIAKEITVSDSIAAVKLQEGLVGAVEQGLTGNLIGGGVVALISISLFIGYKIKVKRFKK